MRALAFASLLFALAGCETTPPAGPVDAGRLGSPDAGRATDAGPAASPDASAPEDAAPAPLCPPSGPFGPGAGDVAEDLVLLDCDGNEHSLHELCERDVVWLFELADWCPPCRAFAGSDANRIYDRFADPAAGVSFEAWTVISEDSGFAPADAEDCAAIRDRYGLRMPVLYDPTGAFQDAFDVPANEVHVVLRRGAVIDWKGRYAGDEVESRIEAVIDGL